MALGLTQPLTEMSTRTISWEVKTTGAQGWQPYHLHVPIVLKSGNVSLLEPSGPVQACNGIALPLLSCKTVRLEDDSMSVKTRSCLTLTHDYLIISKMRTCISLTGVFAASVLRFLDHTKLDTESQYDSPERLISRSQSSSPTHHTTHTTDDTSMPSAGFEPAIAAIKLPQTYALDDTTTGIGRRWYYY